MGTTYRLARRVGLSHRWRSRRRAARRFAEWAFPPVGARSRLCPALAARLQPIRSDAIRHGAIASVGLGTRIMDLIARHHRRPAVADTLRNAVAWPFP